LGMFSYLTNGGQGATSIKSADFDKNGFKDLVICSEGTLPTGKNGSIIQIWLNNGKGDFVPDQYLMNNADDSMNIREFEVADIDNDSWPDIIMHGIGGVSIRGKLANSNFGQYFKLNNLIWKNNKSVFDIIPNELNIYDSTNLELIGNSNFIKGFMVNGKLKFVGFENGNSAKSNNLYEITVNFCNNLVKPTFNNSKFSFCSGDTLKLSIANINKGDTLKWYQGNKLIGNSNPNSILTAFNFTDTGKLYVMKIDSLGCKISSDTVSVIKYAIPTAPTLYRDTVNYLVSNAATGNTWFKEGTAIADTAQKIKPTTPGSYTVKTTQNGCTSVMSSPYYYLVTDIIQLSNGEFIKLAPNPFVNQLNLDFNIKGYQKLNMDVFEMTTGNKVYSSKALYAGTPISLGALAPGTYIIKFTSNDNKIVQQFKMVKM